MYKCLSLLTTQCHSMRNKALMAMALSLMQGLFAWSFASDLEEYTVKAALTLNFARFTEWPSAIINDSTKRINLCTLGDNVIQEAFSGLESKTVSNKSIIVVNLARIRDLGQCHLLFVSGLEKNKTIQLIQEISMFPVLTIGEDDSFLKNGGMVILKIVDGRVNMKINLDAVTKTGLKINSRVLKLATIVSP